MTKLKWLIMGLLVSFIIITPILTAQPLPVELTRSLIASVSSPTRDTLGRYQLHGSLGEPIASFTLVQSPYQLQSGYWNEQFISPNFLTYLPIFMKGKHDD